MTRTTASIFLFLLLVTTAGAVLPSFGGLPRVAEENTARADIGEPGATRAARTHALPPGIVARNAIEGDYIPVCGLIWDDLRDDVQAVINTLNAELKATPPGVTSPPKIMKHNAFKWFDRCRVDDIDLATKIGFVEITLDPIPCGHTDDSTLGCFEDVPPDPPGPLYTIQKSPKVVLKWKYFAENSVDLSPQDKRRWVIAHELAHAIGYADQKSPKDCTTFLGTTPTLMVCLPPDDKLAAPYLKAWDLNHHMRLFEPAEVKEVTKHIATRINPTTVRFQIDASDVKVEDEITIRRKIGTVWSTPLHTWDHKASTGPVSLLNQPTSGEYGIFRTTKATFPGQVLTLGFLQEVTVGEPQPEVSIGVPPGNVTEGNPAEFIIKRKRTSQSNLAVSLYEEHDGSFFESTNTPGNRTVTIPAGSLSTKHTVVTVNDSTDERNGSVTITIKESPTGKYDRKAPYMAEVPINDNDVPIIIPPDPCPGGCGDCERCTSSGCVSTCGGCEECSSGSCVSACGDCDQCVSGTCTWTCGPGELCFGPEMGCLHPCEVPGFPGCRRGEEEEGETQASWFPTGMPLFASPITWDSNACVGSGRHADLAAVTSEARERLRELDAGIERARDASLFTAVARH